MEPSKPQSLEFISTSGRRITTKISDLSEYREQWQMVVFLVLSLGALFWGVQFVGEHGALGKELHSALRYVIPLIAYSAFVIVVGFYVSWRRMSEQTEIKIIKFDDDGLYLGTKRLGASEFTKVPWWDVEALEIIDDRKSGQSVLFLATRSLKTYKIKWNNAFAWVEPETFFIELKTHAPTAALNFAQSDITAGEESARYTNLWLQYFSSPDTRKRRSVLPGGTELNDGRYRILKRLGGGGQGTVYLATARATDLALGAPMSEDDETFVVLKEYVLPVHRGSSLAERQYELLSGEAQILGQINHRSIAKLLDCFVEDHRGYLVLDYVNGDSLKSLVHKNGPLQEALVSEVVLGVCDILSYLHNSRPAIVHRDITPDNLLCNENGQIFLIDFTVAHQLQSTRTATVVGKQAYIPPEQFRGVPTPQSDIYALGCTMFFLLTGQDPEPMQQSHPKQLVPTLSDKMNSIVARATAFDLHDRYLNAEQIVDDLQNL